VLVKKPNPLSHKSGRKSIIVYPNKKHSIITKQIPTTKYNAVIFFIFTKTLQKRTFSQKTTINTTT